MKKIFKWNGDWLTVLNHIPARDLGLFGKPVTSVRNLGLWKNGQFENCRIGDVVIKNHKNYEVLKCKD